MTGPPQGELDPTAFIPVTAADVARRKRRIIAVWISAAVVIAAGAVWIHKRSTDPLKAQEAFDAGRQLMTVARYNEAILSFDRALALNSDLAEAWLMRGRAHSALYQIDAAVPDFTKAIKLRAQDPRPLLERGQAQLALKNYAAAIADADAAASLDPNLAPAYNLRGVALRETGKPRQALQDLNRAVQLAANADNYFQRGATFQQLGEYAHAVDDFTKTIAFQPDLAQAYYARAQAERSAGDAKSADADHQRARSLDGQ
jgi:tetratricopeptide (TPR) repeat protein